jgi:hypothetical protein
MNMFHVRSQSITYESGGSDALTFFVHPDAANPSVLATPLPEIELLRGIFAERGWFDSALQTYRVPESEHEMLAVIDLANLVYSRGASSAETRRYIAALNDGLIGRIMFSGQISELETLLVTYMSQSHTCLHKLAYAIGRGWGSGDLLAATVPFPTWSEVPNE